MERLKKLLLQKSIELFYQYKNDKNNMKEEKNKDNKT